MDPAAWRALKAELMSRGVVVADGPDGAGGGGVSRAVRRGGAGPSHGLTLTVEGSPVSVPVVAAGDPGADFLLREDEGRTMLLGPGLLDLPVEVVRPDPFLGRVTSDGTEFGKVAVVHGADCLASTVIQACVFWETERGCRFCAIGTSLRDGRTTAWKSPGQLAEVAAAAAREGVATHVVLTSGCTEEGMGEVLHLAACTRAVKTASGLPVSVQFRPPADPRAYGLLRDAGVDTVGMHIESLDPRTLALVAPAKAAIGWRGYVGAWREAVSVFGRGQVTTYVIVGLGERLPLTVRRLAQVAAMGVYPHVVPFRPLPGAALEGGARPPAGVMEPVYAAAAAAVREAGLSARGIKAGCGRCTACSAMSEWEASG